MNIYEEYAKNKLIVKQAQEKLKELEPKILEEIKYLSAPMKNDYGTYSKITRESWKYTKDVEIREEAAKSKVEEIMKTVEQAKEAERLTGKAQKTETVGLRFSEVK